MLEEMPRRNKELTAPHDLSVEGGYLSVPVLELIADAQSLLVARDEQRRDAPEWIRQLEDLPEAAIEDALENSIPLSWGLAEALVERSRVAIFDAQPTKALFFARLATQVSDRVDPMLFGSALIKDLQAQTWGAFGNACRIAGHFDHASVAFEEVEQRLLGGTGDPLESATLLSLRASLRTDLGDYASALDLLDEAIVVYRDIDDSKLLARTLLQKGVVLSYQDPEAGLVALVEAMRCLDPDTDSRLFLFTRHAQIHALEASGRAFEANQLLEVSRPLYRREGGDWFNLRLAWLEAKLCCSLGRLDEADAGLNVILTEVMERKLHLEAALAALDLAACRILQGRSREAAELARSMAGLFEAWGVHRRALEAWSVVQHALATETATITLLRDVAGYLTRAWRNPEIPFAVSI